MSELLVYTFNVHIWLFYVKTINILSIIKDKSIKINQCPTPLQPIIVDTPQIFNLSNNFLYNKKLLNYEITRVSYCEYIIKIETTIRISASLL